MCMQVELVEDIYIVSGVNLHRIDSFKLFHE